MTKDHKRERIEKERKEGKKDNETEKRDIKKMLLGK